MEILAQKTFQQPNDGAIITIRRLGTPFYPPCSCERLVDGRVQEGEYGCSKEQTKKRMREWEEFERKIKSEEM